MTYQEHNVENALMQMLAEQGWQTFVGEDISPYGENPQRESFSSVLPEEEVKRSLRRVNPDLPQSALNEAFVKVLNLGTNDLMSNNEHFHQMLTDGVTIEYFDTTSGKTRAEIVRLFDFENVANNSFWAVRQFEVRENNKKRIPDVVLFANGFPLVVVELKSATSEEATLQKAYQQIQTYKKDIPSIFYYNALVILSDGVEARASSLSAPFARFLPWRGPKERRGENIPELQMMSEEMLRHDVLLDLTRFNTVFETEEVKDEKTGQIRQVKVKKVAAYHQYYAVKKTLFETLRATEKEAGDRKIGVVWHTQGSGKSLSMVFYVGQLVAHPKMKNPTVVILTDRNDLDDQLFGVFASCKSLLRGEPVQAKSRAHLRELLQTTGGGIIFTTIQKFYPEDGGEEFEVLTDRENVVVIADEAHRSQYGFKARVVETEDGAKTRYGNAKYLRDALPNASFVGFTGTPVELEDRNTKKVFGDYIDIYDIKRAVEDGATVPISYESRLIKVRMDKKTAGDIDKAIEEISNATEDQIEKAKKKYAQINAIVGHPERLQDLASDIVRHFEARQEVFEGKAMVVVMTRQIAVDLYEKIVELRPDWESDDLMRGKIKVVMTSSSDDPEPFQKHRTTKDQRRKLAVRFKDPNDELQMVIVQSMWLTGFDAPPLHTMYIDKKMQGANLMQAIARVNRVYKDKPGGLIVDYIGIGQDLKNAMAVYTESGGEGEAVTDIAEVIAGMKEKYEVVAQMLHGFDWKKYFTEDDKGKLQVLLDATNFVLADEDLKKRFVSEVTKLSKLFAMSTPSFEAEQIREDVAFFQAIKSRIAKFTPAGGKTDAEVNMAVKQIVDEALSSDGVVDIFQAAGVKAPSLEILSEEFLEGVKKTKQEHLAFELLKKLLSDEVKVRKKRNLVQGKKFSEMLESAIKKYHNNQITTAQVIEELTEIAREIKREDKRAQELGMTEAEYAFYTVLAENESTAFLSDEKMRELIHRIVETVRNNATVDWEKREDIRAKLRVTVKRLLVRYGYPPDLARMEADRVLAQSELLAEEFVKSS